MGRIVTTALLLAGLPLPGCRSSGEAAGVVDAPADLTGTWTVVGHHLPGAAAMTKNEAATWRGRTVRLTSGAAAAGERHCSSPAYATRLSPRDSLLAAEYRLSPGKLARAGLPERVTVLDVSCADSAWTALGGRLIGIGPDRALAPWNGVFFELARDDDFRAVGQEPGWLSGQPYETTVTVILDGQSYHGCGGPLP